MDRRAAKETTCKHCGEVFPSKGNYQVHFCRYHQNNIKTQNINEFETTKLRSETQKFECICGKSYFVLSLFHVYLCARYIWTKHPKLDTTERPHPGLLAPHITLQVFFLFHRLGKVCIPRASRPLHIFPHSDLVPSQSKQLPWVRVRS